MNAIERSIFKMAVAEACGRTIDTPFGPFSIIACEKGLMYASWGTLHPFEALLDKLKAGERTRAFADQAEAELHAYFYRGEVQFQVPLVYHGTPFQEAVWAGLRSIPYGQTWSYRELALQIGNPLAVRAVGQANRANRIAVVIPCHRVIGANGALVGYAGSETDLKASLLRHEQSVVACRQTSDLVRE
ncbi:methylated-DNA--[protein]-cysteine S-methyltransferase [Alicyclobacillus fastidiosus]|uniref:Methylated-DNA--[protein]-cysteine S-methyltransferase n=1 Tax=Alicyclobacillus fastidiosus TaxID=392011 RepID=A0ABV5AJJ9_9BACL|nr:methylated-DNA--[protein]-cysteine S-methyltransferase [Alicyclobacillus fastidiosus]WEH09332.1 methylated-DNA--[protein]-cysteine S-methyltransferase [Alicyclobacillus fastidiosus]